MGLRREGRELALQTLYGLDLNPVEVRESLRLLRENTRVQAAVRAFAEELVTGVMEHREEIDRKIDEQSKNWAIARNAIQIKILSAAGTTPFGMDLPVASSFEWHGYCSSAAGGWTRDPPIPSTQGGVTGALRVGAKPLVSFEVGFTARR